MKIDLSELEIRIIFDALARVSKIKDLMKDSEFESLIKRAEELQKRNQPVLDRFEAIVREGKFE